MKNTVARRDLLKMMAASAALSSCRWAPEFLAKTPNTILFSGYRVGEPYVAKDAGLHIGGAVVDKRIKLANEIHSAVHSSKLDAKVFVPKLETTAYFQIENGELQPFSASSGNYFYGHGAIDEKRGLLYTTQALKTKNRADESRVKTIGEIFVHELPGLKQVGSFSSFGHDPHDMKIVNDQLIVCNGGANSSVTFIDLNTHKLVKEFKVGVKDLSLRHIEEVDPDNYVIATLTRNDADSCPLYTLNTVEGIKKHPSPPAVDERFLKFQMLSVRTHGGFVYGTCPATDALIVYELGKGFVASLKVPSACNLSYSKALGGMLVGSAYDSEPARLVNVVGGKITATKIEWAKALTGAHSLLIES